MQGNAIICHLFPFEWTERLEEVGQSCSRKCSAQHSDIARTAPSFLPSFIPSFLSLFLPYNLRKIQDIYLKLFMPSFILNLREELPHSLL